MAAPAASGGNAYGAYGQGGNPTTMADDPFQTHTLAAHRPSNLVPSATLTEPMPHAPYEATEIRDVIADPFMTGMRQLAPLEGVDNDPFLTHQHKRSPAQLDIAKYGSPGIQQGLSGGPAPAGPPYEHLTPARDWVEVWLGGGDPSRKRQELRMLVIIPWLIFIWTLLLWLLMRHYSMKATMLLTFAMGLGSLSCIVGWLRGLRSQSTSLVVIGLLAFLAVVAGTGLGVQGYHAIWRQFWWTQTGNRYKNTEADTPGGARVDAAVVGFMNTTGTRVDNFRSAGYKAGNTYCVAPVLNPATVAAGLARVNYWVVGMDCCESLGSFYCDDSRNHLGSYGVVMLDKGYPCPGCNVDKFQAAISKAEAAHGLVTANGAMYVRWVADPWTIEWKLGLRGVMYIAVCIILSYPPIVMIAFPLWYKGLGKYIEFDKRELEKSRAARWLQYTK